MTSSRQKRTHERVKGMPGQGIGNFRRLYWPNSDDRTPLGHRTARRGCEDTFILHYPGDKGDTAKLSLNLKNVHRLSLKPQRHPRLKVHVRQTRRRAFPA